MASLFVGKLPDDCTGEMLRAHFTQFGKIEKCGLIPGKPAGYVVYSNEEQAAAALAELNGKPMRPGQGPIVVRGKKEKPSVESATAAANEAPPAAMFVSGLPSNVDETMVRGIFEPIGKVLEVVCLPNQSRKGLRCALVRTSTASEARAAVQQLSGKHKVEGAPEPIVVKFKDARVEQKEEQARKEQLLMQQQRSEQNQLAMMRQQASPLAHHTPFPAPHHECASRHCLAHQLNSFAVL